MFFNQTNIFVPKFILIKFNIEIFFFKFAMSDIPLYGMSMLILKGDAMFFSTAAAYASIPFTRQASEQTRREWNVNIVTEATECNTPKQEKLFNTKCQVSCVSRGCIMVVVAGRRENVYGEEGRVYPTLEDVVVAVFIVAVDDEGNSNGVTRDQKQTEIAPSNPC
jgi:hypothetical protein